MKKVLIISYYWPPSGGAGVQRWVKLTKFLSEFDIEMHVLTVDEKFASYSVIDESLKKDIKEKIKVYKTKSFEPINIYGKIFGKKNIPTSGFSNVDNSSLKQKLANFIRSNVFIPDPRRCWNNFAFKKACEIIEKYSIDNIITTSPPHSTQLLGLKLKNKYKANWIADLRDPWTDIYYYPLLNHSFISKKIDSRYEKMVLMKADKLIVVSQGIQELLISKDKNINPLKFNILPNGFDPEDFEETKINNNIRKFTISYTGTMSSAYKPQIVLDVIEELNKENDTFDFEMNFVGNISEGIEKYISNLKISKFVNIIPNVPHDNVIDFQLNSHILFLVIPDVIKADGILTGKIFEYLATRNLILGLGPKKGDAAKIINFTTAGQFFDRTEKAKIKSFLLDNYNKFITGEFKKNTSQNINEFNRKLQASKIYDLLD